MAGLQLLLIESKLSNNVISNVITLFQFLIEILENLILFLFTYCTYVCMYIHSYNNIIMYNLHFTMKNTTGLHYASSISTPYMLTAHSFHGNTTHRTVSL